MKKLLISLFVLFTITLPMAAFAQDAGVVEVPGETIVVNPTPSLDDNPGDFFMFLLEKIQGGEWLPVFGLVLVLVTLLIRKYLLSWLAKKWKKLEWFQTRLGGKVLAFSLAVLGAVGTALGAGQPVSLSLVSTALGVAWAASGGWEDIKDILNSRKKEEEE